MTHQANPTVFEKTTESRVSVILLAAGKGSRMHSNTPKQFLELAGKPLLFYPLFTLEQSPLVDEVILVTGEDTVSFCRESLVEAYGFQKVKAIVPGGAERYQSVYQGLLAVQNLSKLHSHVVLIHDGARPFLTEEILSRVWEATLQYQAAIAAVPSKDTVKLMDARGFIAETPCRSQVWNAQTPQGFLFPVIMEAFQNLMEEEEKGNSLFVTDDAAVVELMGHCPVKLVEGSYENIKVTTPEDLFTAARILEKQEKRLF